jgi:hypothetical protein
MQIAIISWDGSTSDGFILGRIGWRLRVAVRGCDDAMEFRCHGGQWFSPSGEPVEIRMYQAGFDEDMAHGVDWEHGMATGDSAAALWVN